MSPFAIGPTTHSLNQFEFDFFSFFFQRFRTAGRLLQVRV